MEELLKYQDDPTDSTISLSANDSILYNSFGNLIYQATKGQSTCEIIFSFENDKLNISIDSTRLLHTTCLMLCGLSLSGQMLDCYFKNKTSWKGFKECIKSQEHTLGITTIACILNCNS